jgi:hypothetical protein
MSADNYMSIRKEGDKWVGYHQSASADEEQYHRPCFSVDSLEEAIHMCQSGKWAGDDDWFGGYLEYGYRVVGL